MILRADSQSSCAAGASSPRSKNLPIAKQALAAFITAIQFLTRLPVSSKPATPESLRLAPLFFPLVGSLIGCVTAGCIVAAQLAWPTWVAVLLALSVEAVLTGALHEDGLADFCDAFGGGWQREDVLRILKDSRVGTYGVLGLVLALSIRAVCLVALVDRFASEHWILCAAIIVAASGAARWVIVLTMTFVPSIAERQTLTTDVASQMSWKVLAASTVGILPPVALFGFLLPVQLALASLLIAMAWLWLTSLIQRKIQGITGDCLGCIGYVTQVLFLLGAVARVS